MIILLAPAVIGGLAISWIVGAHTYIIFLPAWLKLFILIIIFFAVINRGEQKYYKFRSMVTFIFRIWFIPFIFRRRGAKGVLVLGKMTWFPLSQKPWGKIIKPPNAAIQLYLILIVKILELGSKEENKFPIRLLN